ncbi:trigger factor [Candidatus Parcubacteria bacterium]|nr:trigger factor [Patescibacteria group bacterium]MCG2693965.1 trigger factor [Candidatus Parcubacteria bacterium]
MKVDIKNLEKSQVELTIELSWDEVKPYLERASEELSQKSKIEGFRPGKAPYDIVRARFGEHAILEAAAEKIIMKNFLTAVKEKNLETVGQPHIDMEKMAVSNPFIFKATVSLLPKTTLGEYKNLEIKKEETKITDEKVKEALDGLTKMQSKELLKDGPAEKEDKIIVDMDILKDNVPIEGGQAKDMAVYLSEAHYIPGFNEEVLGLKKGDEKEFDLNFPEEHYQKHLSGAKVHFKVKAKDVYKIEAPELNEEFAKTLGQKSIEDLTALIRKNLEHEEMHKTEEKWEISILNKIVLNSKFSDIPELLVNGEANQMIYELKNNITRQGLSFEDYLKSINKTEAELKLEFSPEAVKRIKISLVIREIAKAEKIEVSDKEIMEEVEKLMNAYKDNADAQKQISRREYADYLKSRIENKKTIDILKKENGQETPHSH